jgi:hypothetical protein
MSDAATPPPPTTEAVTLEQIRAAWARLEQARGQMSRAWTRYLTAKHAHETAHVRSARQELGDAEAAYNRTLNAASPEVQAAYFAAPEKPVPFTRESIRE